MLHWSFILRALVPRPLRRDLDVGSDTDFTQSSMEDVSVRYSKRRDEASICDHRSPEQKHYRAGSSQTRRPTQRKQAIYSSLAGLLKRLRHRDVNYVSIYSVCVFIGIHSCSNGPCPPQLLLEDGRGTPCLLPCSVLLSRSVLRFSFLHIFQCFVETTLCRAMWLTWHILSSQSAEWCGPDGSVVLIRAVRSGLDRVVLELLRAGVPVNNTDHTGNESMSQLGPRRSPVCV